MKPSEIKGYSDSELQTNLKDVQTELVELKYNHRVNQIENPARITGLRKTIARINTEIRQREISAK